jgi:hypothetical protein
VDAGSGLLWRPGERLYVIGANDAEVTPVQGSNVDILAEKRFGDLILPSRLRVGWRHGTEEFSPFFEAEIISAVPNDRGRQAAGFR